MKTTFMLLLALAISLSAKAANPTCGLTIITHGYQSGGYLPDSHWTHLLAQAITNRIGASLPIYRLRYDKQSLGTTADDLIQLEDGAEGIEITQSGGAIILLDWADASNETVEYPTQNVANKFFEYIFGRTHDGRSLAEIPIHLIGHSRGCSLNAQLVMSLAGNGVLVDQVTTLDPHPVRPFDAPVGGNDLIPVTYINVLFADNYYRTGMFPAGESVAGAMNNNLSATIDGDDCREHESVHTYFHGTVALTATAIDGCNIQNIWYQQSTARDETGYNFSRFVNPLLPRPSSGVNQFIAGAGGTGSRVSVDSPQQLWSNAGFDQRNVVPSAVRVGQTVEIPYYYADRSSAQTITFHTDADTNPYNGFRSQIGSIPQNPLPAGSIGTATFQWTPTAADIGTHYIRIRGANASNARFDYYLKSITVQAAAIPDPTISSVTPRTFTGPTKKITITGTGFTSSSRLTFNDGVNPPDTGRVPSSWTAMELTYDLNVGSKPATWTVKVVNGAVESLPYSFYVVPGTAQLTSLGVSGPAAIVENNGGQFTATAYFSDGSQQNVTSSASWSQNSGAASISSSGFLSAGGVSADAQVTVSASYTTGGITKSGSASVTIVNSASCGSTISEKILNGSFSNNGNNWTLTGNFFANANFQLCNSCPGYAWFANADGTGGNNLSGTLSQSITIPANAASVTLGYYYRITTSETGGSAFDVMSLNLVLPGGTLVGLDERSNLHANGSYGYRSFDITAYRGQTITVRFTAATDASLPTVFRVDDVSVLISAPNPVTPVLFGVSGPTTVAEGATAQYSAIVVNCDGSVQSVSPTWIENSSVTTISSSGLLTIGSVNSDTPVTITATYSGSTSLNYPITVINSVANFSYLAINGPSSIEENSSGQFSATAILSDGSSQSVSPSWSENSAVTTISSGGLLSANEVSANTIISVSASHSINGVTRTANQDVLVVNSSQPATLSSLTISGPNIVDENSVAQYSATALFSDGSLQIVSPIWSEDSGATSISTFGLLSTGEVASNTPATVSASYTAGGVTRNAQTNVTVLNTVTAQTFTLAVSATNGAVTKNPNQPTFASGSQVVLTAHPENGYIFSGWGGDATGNQNPLTVVMTTNKNIIASFLPVVPPNQPYEAKWAVPMNTFRVYASAPARDGGMVFFGTFTGTITAGGQSLTANGTPSDFYGVKINSLNQVVWVRQYGGPNEEGVESCAQHPDGGWAIAGTFRNPGDIGGISLVPEGNRDAYLARLDESGNVLWAKRGGGTSIDYGSFAGVDGAGNCWLFGKFTTSATFTGSGVTLNAVGARFDIFVAKYSSAGNFLWAKSGGGPEYDDLYSAKVDASGNAYLGGIFEIQTTFGPYTVVNLGASTDWDGFLTKLNSDGNVLWLKKFGQTSATSSTDSINFVAPVGDGTCLFGGQYSHDMLVDGHGLPNQTSTFTAFVGKIDTAGAVAWLRGIPSTTLPEVGVYTALSRAGRGLPLADGGLIVSGSYRGKLAVGSTTLTNANSDEYLYISKFDSGGTPTWTISSDSPGFGYMHYFERASGERVRFAARIWQPVGLPGISTINAISDDSVLIELGPPEIVIPPVVSMNLVGGNVVLTWPATATGFVLEWATNLPPAGWTANSAVPASLGGSFTVTNQISGGMKFFRLKK